jgi:hypothetical protein
MRRACCGILPERPEDLLGRRNDGYLPECVLPAGHDGPHVFYTPEGKYFAWEEDKFCLCCDPWDLDTCYDCWEVTVEYVERLRA